jgi:hypothetical protein
LIGKIDSPSRAPARCQSGDIDSEVLPGNIEILPGMGPGRMKQLVDSKTPEKTFDGVFGLGVGAVIDDAAGDNNHSPAPGSASSAGSRESLFHVETSTAVPSAAAALSPAAAAPGDTPRAVPPPAAVVPPPAAVPPPPPAAAVEAEPCVLVPPPLSAAAMEAEAQKTEKERQNMIWYYQGKKITPAKLQTEVNKASSKRGKEMVKQYEGLVNAVNNTVAALKQPNIQGDGEDKMSDAPKSHWIDF